MNPSRKKILLAIDGSEQSIDALRYVSKVLAPQDIEMVLFHVMGKRGEVFLDMGITPLTHNRMPYLSGWEAKQNETVKEFMDKSRQILLEAGFPQELITVKIQQRKLGIARDIIIESQDGYSAVVVGRKGLSKLKDIVLGSVANRLIEKLTHVPVWVVGGRPEPEKILLALDSSEGSMLAVDHVGAMVGGSNPEVTLLHVIKGMDSPQMIFYLDYEQDLIKEVKKEMQSVFDEAKTRLTNSGLDPSHIKTKFIPGAGSRSIAIYEEAKQGGYGTIALGRRGLSKVEEFFMGRVSNKVIHMAKEMAVWVVS